jgi:hypothetical protein
MFKMNLHDPFGYLKHKLWPKEGLGVKLAIWLPTTKSQELPWFPYVQVACHIPLKRSQQGLQLYFRHHFNQRSTKVMSPQSCESPNLGNFETPTWESRDKMTSGCWPHGQAQKILQGERWWLPPSSGHGESCESVFVCGLLMHQKCCNYALSNFLFGLCKSVWIIDLLVTRPNPILELQHALLPPKCSEPRSTLQLLLLPLFSPLDSQLNPSRSLAVHHFWFQAMYIWAP